MQHSREHTDQVQVRAGAVDDTAAPAGLADLASARVGGRALFASDDFFAPRANLLKPAAALFIPGKFTTRGKWMDGWESRRKRTPGHDWAVVRLGARGTIARVEVDTRHFKGNAPAACSLDVRIRRSRSCPALTLAPSRLA